MTLPLDPARRTIMKNRGQSTFFLSHHFVYLSSESTRNNEPVDVCVNKE